VYLPSMTRSPITRRVTAMWCLSITAEHPLEIGKSLAKMSQLAVKPKRGDHDYAACSIPRRGRKQSVVPRQGKMLAVFRIVPSVDIKFVGKFWGQTTDMVGVSGCRPFDHVPVITKIGEIFVDQCVP
jgi:hypothetical protein